MRILCNLQPSGDGQWVSNTSPAPLIESINGQQSDPMLETAIVWRDRGNARERRAAAKWFAQRLKHDEWKAKQPTGPGPVNPPLPPSPWVPAIVVRGNDCAHSVGPVPSLQMGQPCPYSPVG
jgi:hypothetical protein